MGFRGFLGVLIAPIKSEYHMEKNMEHEMETAIQGPNNPLPHS